MFGSKAIFRFHRFASLSQDCPLYYCSVSSVVDANVYSLTTENFPQSAKINFLLDTECEMRPFKGLHIIKRPLISIPFISVDKSRFLFGCKFHRFGDAN